MKYLLVCLFYIGPAFSQMNDFPISAFHVDDTTWFTGAGADSLGLNLIWLGGGERDESIKLAKLSAADNHGLKAQLYNALKGSQSGDWNCNELEWYGRLFYTSWDIDSSNFDKSIGNWVFDPAAQDSDAWKATVAVDSPGNLLVGPNPATYTRSDLIYDAHFFLKTDSLGDPQVKVCSIWVKNGDVVKMIKVVMVSDFSTANDYYDITLSFPNTHNTGLNYGLYWYGNRTLWVDYIETQDRYISAVADSGNYDDTLSAIISVYNSSQALEYYYLLDEPDIGNFKANAYLIWFLNQQDYKPGIQITSYQWPSIYESYVDMVNPNILTMNYYPLLGAYFGADSTPWETGGEFQERLDVLCSKIGEARKVTKQHNNIPLWYICQSLGQYDTTTHTTAYNRESTPRELKCMIWLALAYGVKGIEHFTYKTIAESNSEHSWIDSGLTYNGLPRYPLWTAAKEMNFLIRDIGARLLELTSDTVFKSNITPPTNCCNVSYVSDTLMQIGTFWNLEQETDRYFIIVNRNCLPSESLEVMVGIDDADSLFIWDCYNQTAISPVEMIGPPPPPFYFNIKLKPGEGKLLRLVPFSQDFQVNQKQTYTNLPYVAIRTKASSILDVDSMVLSQVVPDTGSSERIYTTGWIAYDTTYAWYLFHGEDTNTIRIQYKVGGFTESPVYSDGIILDKTAPSGSFVINNNDRFTNNPMVSIKNFLSDSKSGMSKMRYGEKFLKNIVTNSSFESRDTVHWKTDNAIYIDSLKLFELPIQTSGNYFLQRIPADSLTAYYNDTLQLAIDLVSDSFYGTGKVKFQYICNPNPDTCLPMGVYPCSDSIIIPLGMKAEVSQYNLNSYFKYYWGQTFSEVRVGVFVAANANNKGKLYIDNFRVDVVGPHSDYARFQSYDTLKNDTLSLGNGNKVLYGQFQDGAGNETAVLYDTIIVDTTKPARKISSPQNGQTINGTVNIKGWAYDYADPQQHFKQYELYYRQNTGFTWYGIYPDSISTTPVNMAFPPAHLGYWNTDTVTARQGNGGYDLKLTVRDSAGNYRDTMIYVVIDNSKGEKGMMAGFSNFVYGTSVDSEIYVGEITTGKIYRYNEDYQLIDTFQLADSIGIGYPVAMASSDSGKLWIANITSHTINRFSSQGNFEYRFGGHLSQPSEITLDDAGNIWVSDRLHHKIKKFSPFGDSLYVFGEKGNTLGKINEPLGIDYYNGKLYVVDSKNKRISVFDTLGSFITVLADSAGLSLPFGIVIDSTGCFTVSDFQGNQVIEFDPWGSPLFTIDTLLDSPSGLALSTNQKRLNISDTKHKRVLIYDLRGDASQGGGGQSAGDMPFKKMMIEVYPTIFSKQLKIKLQAVVGKKLTLKIYDVTGRLVNKLLDNTVMVTDRTIFWDGKDEFNRSVPNGIYFIQVDIDGKKKTNKALMIK